MKTKIHFHGELVIIEKPNADVKSGMKKLNPTQDVKLADSEVTGNDHMLQFNPGVHVWSDETADKFLVKTEVDTKIYCKISDRHTDLKLKGGYCYEIGKAQEWDYIKQERRNVRD